MKKKFDIGSLITTIVIVGFLVSFISSDFPIGEIFGDLGESGMEALLDSINPVLAFAALAGVFIFLIARAARGEKEDRGIEDGEWEE